MIAYLARRLGALVADAAMLGGLALTLLPVLENCAGVYLAAYICPFHGWLENNKLLMSADTGGKLQMFEGHYMSPGLSVQLMHAPAPPR